MLTISPCRSLCDWSATRAEGELQVFACAGCGSEWIKTERWTPRQHDGSVPAAVLAELRCD